MRLAKTLVKDLAVLAALAFTVSSALAAYTYQSVGDGGNSADGDTGLGAVATQYYIGTTEVTNADYAAFLNDAAKSDPNSLWNANMALSTGGITRSGTTGSYLYEVKSNMGNKPVNFVSLLDAARYVNWLNNPTGNISDQAYTITGSNLSARNEGFTYYLPSRDEWYKAAYYNGASDTYYNYATQTSTVTTATATSTGDVANPGANVVNFGSTANWDGSTGGNVTSVGSAGATSYYGTYDQNGNVAEWVETSDGSGSYYVLGGDYNSANTIDLHKWTTLATGQGGNIELADIGFRVYRVPEPTALLLALLAGTAGLFRRRRRA